MGETALRSAQIKRSFLSSSKVITLIVSSVALQPVIDVDECLATRHGGFVLPLCCQDECASADDVENDFWSLADSTSDFDHFSNHLFGGPLNRLIRRAGPR